MINKTIFAHLFKHAQTHKRELDYLLGLKSRSVVLCNIAQSRGALECLYYQALGMGELLLAKHIRRVLNNPTRQLKPQLNNKGETARAAA